MKIAAANRDFPGNFSNLKCFLTIVCKAARVRKTTFPALSADELAQAGEALFGADWRMPMARALGLPDDAAIRAVEAGRMEAPAEWRARLIATAQDTAVRAMDIAGVLLWRESEEKPSAASYSTPRLL